MKDSVIELDGKVVEVLPNQMFRVKLNDTDEPIIAYLSGKLRMNFIRIVVGDVVTVKMDPNDMTKGRITWRVR